MCFVFGSETETRPPKLVDAVERRRAGVAQRQLQERQRATGHLRVYRGGGVRKAQGCTAAQFVQYHTLPCDHAGKLCGGHGLWEQLKDVYGHVLQVV